MCVCVYVCEIVREGPVMLKSSAGEKRRGKKRERVQGRYWLFFIHPPVFANNPLPQRTRPFMQLWASSDGWCCQTRRLQEQPLSWGLIWLFCPNFAKTDATKTSVSQSKVGTDKISRGHNDICSNLKSEIKQPSGTGVYSKERRKILSENVQPRLDLENPATSKIFESVQMGQIPFPPFKAPPLTAMMRSLASWEVHNVWVYYVPNALLALLVSSTRYINKRLSRAIIISTGTKLLPRAHLGPTRPPSRAVTAGCCGRVLCSDVTPD